MPHAGLFKPGHIPWNKGKPNCFSDETRQKMSDSHIGKQNWNYGRPMTEHTKQKIRESNLGRPMSEYVKQKLKESKIDWHPSEKTIQKMANSHKKHDYANCMCFACRNRRGEGIVPWHKGRTGVYTQETLQKMSDAKKGKHHSDATKKLVSEAVTKRYRRLSRKSMFDEDGKLILPTTKHHRPIDIAVSKTMHVNGDGVAVLPQEVIDGLFARQINDRIDLIKKTHAEKRKHIHVKRRSLTTQTDIVLNRQ